jgi:hypothetical protein
MSGPIAITATFATIPPAPKPVETSPPSITGTPLPGNTLTCNPGTWTDHPTFTFTWSRGTNQITGAVTSTYTVTIFDEGQSISCIVTASNGGGASAPAGSSAKIVAQSGTLTCPHPSGSMTAGRIGPLALNETRMQARAALTHYHVTFYGFDDFCLFGGWGIRGAYKQGKFVLLLTANPYYGVNTVTDGFTIQAAAKHLKIGKVIVIGANDWYIAPGTSSNYVLKVRHGIVLEIGIANKKDTTGRAKQTAFLSSNKAV